MSIAEITSNGGYIARTNHLLYPGKDQWRDWVCPFLRRNGGRVNGRKEERSDGEGLRGEKRRNWAGCKTNKQMSKLKKYMKSLLEQMFSNIHFTKIP